MFLEEILIKMIWGLFIRNLAFFKLRSFEVRELRSDEAMKL